MKLKPARVSRPSFPPGYADHPSAEVPWEQVAERLRTAKHYWVCSVRADGRPHCVPRWGVYVDGLLYYDGSPQTRHARNLLENPHVSLHLESGEQAVILEGSAKAVGAPVEKLAGKLSAAFKDKYAADGYAPDPDQWERGGLYVFTPRVCLAWTVFFEDATKFEFE